MSFYRAASLPLFILLALIAVPTAGSAEPGNYDALGRALALMAFAALCYLAWGITLLVLAIRKRWSGFRIVLGLGVVIAIILPLLDTLLLKYQQVRVAGAEIRKAAPDLTGAGVLFVSEGQICNYAICESLLQLRGKAPLYALGPEQLEGLDLASAIDLSDVPMIRWVPDPERHNSYKTEEVGADRPVFNYVVIDRRPFYLTRAGAFENALTVLPERVFLGRRLVLSALAAPIPDNRLDLGALDPDYLSLEITRDAMTVPLFPENTIYGTSRDYEWKRQRANWFCPDTAPKDRQYNCKRALR